ILELHIRTKKPKKLINLKTDQNQSFFSLKKLTIKNNKLPLMVDNALEVATPVEINVFKRKINIIVGKERNF
ncbi:MAG: hypothetical protein ABH830_03760, partial [Patescibacteria group bacterium]